MTSFGTPGDDLLGIPQDVSYLSICLSIYVYIYMHIHSSLYVCVSVYCCCLYRRTVLYIFEIFWTFPRRIPLPFPLFRAEAAITRRRIPPRVSVSHIRKQVLFVQRFAWAAIFGPRDLGVWQSLPIYGSLDGGGGYSHSDFVSVLCWGRSRVGVYLATFFLVTYDPEVEGLCIARFQGEVCMSLWSSVTRPGGWVGWGEGEAGGFVGRISGFWFIFRRQFVLVG